jgi:hypothetical protein
MWRALALLTLTLLPVTSAGAARHPEAELALDVFEPPRPGRVPEAAPSRFVLQDDGRVFVGGTSRIAAGRLEDLERKDLEKLIALVRKLPGLGSSITLGPGDTRYRLWLRRGRGVEIVAKGDPAAAPPALRPLAQLLERLSVFNHASLVPLAPTQLVLSAREERLDGGCRQWTLPPPLADVLVEPRLITADAARGWPTGAVAASVCAGDKRYSVALRPLLPGERP